MVWSQRHTLEIPLKELAIIVGQLLRAAARIEVVAQCPNDQRLDLGRGNAADQSRWLGPSLQYGLGDVIAITDAALVGMGWAHAVGGMVENAAGQERGCAPQHAAPRHRPGRKLGLHRLERRGTGNQLVDSVLTLEA